MFFEEIMFFLQKRDPIIVVVSATSLVTYAGERYDFLLKADSEIDNYWIRFRGLMDCDERYYLHYSHTTSIKVI